MATGHLGQVGPDLVEMPGLVVVTDLESAQLRLDAPGHLGKVHPPGIVGPQALDDLPHVLGTRSAGLADRGGQVLHLQDGGHTAAPR